MNVVVREWRYSALFVHQKAGQQRRRSFVVAISAQRRRHTLRGTTHFEEFRFPNDLSKTCCWEPACNVKRHVEII